MTWYECYDGYDWYFFSCTPFWVDVAVFGMRSFGLVRLLRADRMRSMKKLFVGAYRIFPACSASCHSTIISQRGCRSPQDDFLLGWNHEVNNAMWSILHSGSRILEWTQLRVTRYVRHVRYPVTLDCFWDEASFELDDSSESAIAPSGSNLIFEDISWRIFIYDLWRWCTLEKLSKCGTPALDIRRAKRTEKGGRLPNLVLPAWQWHGSEPILGEGIGATVRMG